MDDTISPFDRPLTHKIIFNIVYFSFIPLRVKQQKVEQQRVEQQQRREELPSEEELQKQIRMVLLRCVVRYVVSLSLIFHNQVMY